MMKRTGVSEGSIEREQQNREQRIDRGGCNQHHRNASEGTGTTHSARSVLAARASTIAFANLEAAHDQVIQACREEAAYRVDGRLDDRLALNVEAGVEQNRNPGNRTELRQ